MRIQCSEFISLDFEYRLLQKTSCRWIRPNEESMTASHMDTDKHSAPAMRRRHSSHPPTFRALPVRHHHLSQGECRLTRPVVAPTTPILSSGTFP